MPLQDLFVYQRYIRRRMSPGRRIELHLAQICKVLMQVNGVKDVRIDQFLFDPTQDIEDQADGSEPDPEAAAESAAQALNFRPRQRPPNTDNPNGDAADGKQPG